MSLLAGTGQAEITPTNSQFLFGYPHVERFSTGVHDPLYSTALCLNNGEDRVLFISNDIIFIEKNSIAIIRKQISEQAGIKPENILISATHTHSGPMTMDYVSNANDPVVPKTDQKYVQFMENRIVTAGTHAAAHMEEVEIGLAIADGTGIGTNRRDPKGPSDMDVPVMAIRSLGEQKLLALMLICSMHPTVLHEDSKLISSDFPGMTRDYIHQKVGKDCAVIYHTGCEGNQSPRHVTQSNTFEEAKRLGDLLGGAVEKVLSKITYASELEIHSDQAFLDLPGRQFPDVSESRIHLEQAVARLNRLREEGASSQKIRTAECDWFGAEETLTLSNAQDTGAIDKVRKAIMPFEIQLIRVGVWSFIAWPGELFIEYGLAIKKKYDNTFVINLANGEAQGYIVTEEAFKEGGYEASNSLFSYTSGDMIVNETKKLLQKIELVIK